VKIVSERDINDFTVTKKDDKTILEFNVLKKNASFPHEYKDEIYQNLIYKVITNFLQRDGTISPDNRWHCAGRLAERVPYAGDENLKGGKIGLVPNELLKSDTNVAEIDFTLERKEHRSAIVGERGWDVIAKVSIDDEVKQKVWQGCNPFAKFMPFEERGKLLGKNWNEYEELKKLEKEQKKKQEQEQKQMRKQKKN
jgi:hypothetical protein